MTDLLPEYSRVLASVWEGIRSVTWEKWVWAAAPFAVALVQPLLEKLNPRGGDGQHLLTVTASRGATVRQHLWGKGVPVVTTVLVGVGLLSQSAILPSLAFLALGFGTAVYVSLDQRRARTQVVFYRNRFKLLGTVYRYDDIAMVVDAPPEEAPGAKVLKWKEFEVTLTKTQYEILRPSLQRQGYGPSETVLDSRQWDLR